MRDTMTALAVIAVLGSGLPAWAQAAGERESGRQTGVEQRHAEGDIAGTHLKAAGYDLIQAQAAMKGKDKQVIRQHLMRAREEMSRAEGEATGAMADEIRRISTSLEKAETTVTRDMERARQDVTRADSELNALIRRHELQRRQPTHR